MSALPYFKRAATLASLNPSEFEKASLHLITNFTDDALAKLITGVALEEGIYPELSVEPYRQYHLSLAEGGANEAQVTFIVLDASSYIANEFSDDAHATETLESIKRYASGAKGHVIVATLPTPYESAYGNHFTEDPFYLRITRFNEGLASLATEHANVSLLSMDRLLAMEAGRDLRGLYAFDVPYTNDFFLRLAKECMSYVFALHGKGKKCLVVDLDNTLWGGVVGEVGVEGIDLGTGYPGRAYEGLQDVLRSLRERGIVLAIASRNNPEDVDEVFARHPHMKLTKDDFASIQVAWEPKSIMLQKIAQELNVGVDSLVFLDDDPVNREEVRSALPSVYVPDLPTLPEEYARFVLSLSCFNQISLTEEDRKKAALYREERARSKSEQEDGSSYLERLQLQVTFRVNDEKDLPRLAQLSQKTNQFNLTTRRYTEEELRALQKEGALLIAAEAKDRFGAYGTIALMILRPKEKVMELATFLMSCRAMGRGIEYALLSYGLEQAAKAGYHAVMGQYLPTAKNTPAKDFLKEAGFAASVEGYEAKLPFTLATPISHITST